MRLSQMLALSAIDSIFGAAAATRLLNSGCPANVLICQRRAETQESEYFWRLHCQDNLPADGAIQHPDHHMGIDVCCKYLSATRVRSMRATVEIAYLSLSYYPPHKSCQVKRRVAQQRVAVLPWVKTRR